MIIDINGQDMTAARLIARKIAVSASLEGHRVTVMEGRRIVESHTPCPRGREFESVTIQLGAYHG